MHYDHCDTQCAKSVSHDDLSESGAQSPVGDESTDYRVKLTIE